MAASKEGVDRARRIAKHKIPSVCAGATRLSLKSRPSSGPYQTVRKESETTMPDPQTGLNLVPAIREIQSQIATIKAEHEQKLKPYLESLEALRKINTACEMCGGEGKKLRARSCAEDDRPDPNDPSDYVTCPACHGSGRKPD